MNRREFLKNLGLAGLVAASPKFIFDVGKNLYKRETGIWVYRSRLYIQSGDFPQVFTFQQVLSMLDDVPECITTSLPS